MQFSTMEARPGLRPFFQVFSVSTIFLSACLLFFVQPLFAKIVLPHIGGAPAVWTVAMLFFQTVLLAGYLYAHLLTRLRSVPQQLCIHALLWGAALLVLPLGVPEGWRYDPSGPPALQALVLFATGVGLPFGFVAANAPLIQHWYARSGAADAGDPYYLYGASNLGSLVALLAFPLVAEPLFGATAIGTIWRYGFVALGLCLAVLGLGAWGAGARADEPELAQGVDGRSAPITVQRVLMWMLMAFVPSSLMLSVTTKISIDVGAIPLVWVIPLSLYLLSFWVTFTQRTVIPTGVARSLCLLGLGLLALLFPGSFGSQVSFIGIGILALSLFAVAVFIHRKLYEDRPEANQLTTFYVVMSVGGALGGLFNSLLSPVLFDKFSEGGITVFIAVMVVIGGRLNATLPRVALGLAVGASVAVLLYALSRFVDDLGMLERAVCMVCAAGLTLFLLRRHISSAAIAAAVVTLAGAQFLPDGTLFRDRSFFGTHHVMEHNGLRYYANGTTIHGAQRMSDDPGDPTPLFYYHRNAPLARLLTTGPGALAQRVGIVGLGVGALACYRSPAQDWEFFEIDRVVDRVARDPALFGFMSACAGNSPTHLGDARMVLAQDSSLFDVLVIDAYSSDAVPVHLTTLEAMQLYLDRLTPNGILIYHISSRYYAIERPLARSAEALGLVGLIEDYQGHADVDPADSGAKVAIFARDASNLGELNDDPRWEALKSDGGRLWTDDFANPLSALR